MATNTRKQLEDAFTEANQPQATTQAEVDAQDARTRLYQSLQTSYGQQIDQSNKGYDQAIAQTDRNMIGRGMQRSSYLVQTMANMQNQKQEAANQIRSNMIADYQSRLNTIEQQEKEDERWERQFAANREDAAWQQGMQEKQFSYQQQRDEVSDQQWKSQFDYQKERNAVADEQWQKQFDAQQAQWREQFDYSKKSAEQQLAWNAIMNMLEKGDKPSDKLLKQAGLSRKDYEQMKTSAVKSGGGRGSGANNTPWGKMGLTEDQFKALYPNEYAVYTGNTTTNTNDPWSTLQNDLNGSGTQTPAPTTKTQTTSTNKDKKKTSGGGGGTSYNYTK